MAVAGYAASDAVHVGDQPTIHGAPDDLATPSAGGVCRERTSLRMFGIAHDALTVSSGAGLIIEEHVQRALMGTQMYCTAVGDCEIAAHRTRSLRMMNGRVLTSTQTGTRQLHLTD